MGPPRAIAATACHCGQRGLSRLLRAVAATAGHRGPCWPSRPLRAIAATLRRPAQRRPLQRGRPCLRDGTLAHLALHQRQATRLRGFLPTPFRFCAASSACRPLQSTLVDPSCRPLCRPFSTHVAYFWPTQHGPSQSRANVTSISSTRCEGPHSSARPASMRKRWPTQHGPSQRRPTVRKSSPKR